MFRRLRALFSGKPRAGDLVTVHYGPHAGETGTVTSAHGQQATVDIGASGELTLHVGSLRLVRRAAQTDSGAPDAGTDVDYEEARARINQLPPPMI